jgi:nucleotide-binding universal stress UspA family protein
MNKDILVAIDGSPSSANSLHYLSHLFAGDRTLSIHLLSVVPAGGTGQDWMFDVDPLRTQTPQTEQRTRRAHAYLDEAKLRLVRAGFAAEQIHYRTKTATTGISTVIHHEAQHGQHDAILVGRRGIGTVGGMFFGSTSSELIEKSHQIPLWIIDGEVVSTRFLLAVQSHPASLLAADHLAFILKDHPSAEICLYHSNSVFGSQRPARPEDFHQRWGKEWCDRYLDIENFLFYAHAQLLMDNGIPKRRITQLPTQMHLDVSADLLRQAKQHHCGTIILGRRGPESSKGLLKGVSERTLQQAQKIAIWLVG